MEDGLDRTGIGFDISQQRFGPDNVARQALGDVAPFRSVQQSVANDDVGGTGSFQGGNQIGADEPRNPLNVAMPVAEPIGADRLAAFRESTRAAHDALALARSLPAAALASSE